MTDPERCVYCGARTSGCKNFDDNPVCNYCGEVEEEDEDD